MAARGARTAAGDTADLAATRLAWSLPRPIWRPSSWGCCTSSLPRPPSSLYWEYGVSPDDKLPDALSASREICPELCAQVKRELNKSGEFQGLIDYERIFQSIVRRHPDVLHHVSIEDFDCNTKRGLRRETLTIITAQRIMSINSDGETNERHWNPL
jgi:hypothetical protein